MRVARICELGLKLSVIARDFGISGSCWVDWTTQEPSTAPRPTMPAGPLVEAVTTSGVVLCRHPAAARTFYRAKRDGHLTLDAADKLAHDLLGEHPATL